MILEFKPRRIIEVGSGFSSCLMPDTNERFFDAAIDITCIDPGLGTSGELRVSPQVFNFGNFGGTLRTEIWHEVIYPEATAPNG